MPATDALQPPLTPDQRQIVKSYGGWTHFMQCFGLKPWVDDDVDEAMSILQGLVNDDSDE